MDVASASCPAVGETVCGDVAVVVTGEHSTLICLADGLGHGPHARTAGETACRVAKENADLSLEALMRAMDAALAQTRGAAVSVLRLEPSRNQATFAGIGNVELRSLGRVPFAPPTMPGILGRGVRTVRLWQHALSSGDLLVMHTDGISSRFDLGAWSSLPLQGIADALLGAHRKPHDDAYCVAVRAP